MDDRRRPGLYDDRRRDRRGGGQAQGDVDVDYRPAIRGGFRGRGRGRGGQRHGGRGRNNAGPREPREQREYTIGYRKLFEFCNKDGDELLHIISSQNSGIPWLLKQQTIKSDWMNLFLSIIGKACKVDHNPAVLLSFLTSVRNSVFLKEVLLRYLTDMMMEADTFKARQFQEPLLNIFILLKCLLQRMPSCVTELIPITTTAELVVNHLRGSNCVVSDDIDRELEQVKEIRTQNLSRGPALQGQDQEEELVEEEPPNDFRQLSIFPTREDIHTDELPFLRANRIKGEYRDLDHYLDIQFRLLREDFLCPLRDGITEFLEHRRDPRHRYQDIRLYQNVSLLNPVCRPSGIAYRIRFDASRLPGVRWESTRRLIYGSLVCLSRDNFRTQLFATVADRSPESLKKGELEIMFQANHNEVSNITPDQMFNMAETSAYFEAYRHVLSGLQQIDDNFPFKEYIIKCAKQIQNPRYLLRGGNPVFDLRSLVTENCVNQPSADRLRRRMRRLAIDDSDEEDDDNDDDDGTDIQVLSKSAGANNLKAVKVLETRRWPAADDFQLDPSQHEALTAALTKELVLIQGPPGTGKTFLGLKIVRALIHNQEVWRTRQPGEEHQSPILVVCYTNHALDQFLEGISEFLKRGIVRVGGRCQSEKLEQFKLAKQRYTIRENRDVPRHIHDGRFDSRNEMDRCKTSIENFTFRISSLDNGLLHEEDLKEYMTEEHYDSLCSQHIFGGHQGRRSKKFTIFFHWLGLDGAIVREAPNEAEGGNDQNAGEEEEEEEEEELVDIEDEHEKEALERMAGNDEEFTQHQKEERRRQTLQRAADQELALQISQLDDGDSVAEDEGGWQLAQGGRGGKGKNKIKKTVKRELIRQEFMTEEEVARIQNVWNLDTRQRWRLYRYWINLHRRYLKEQVQNSERQYHVASERHKEVLEDEDRWIMQRATVIGMTTTCAARYRRALQQIRPKVIIVEEAAEVLEAHIITTLSPGCEHLILIGDHQQLRPNPNVFELAEKYNLKISLFERLIMNGIPHKTLEKQHRMRPEISDVLQHIYPGLRDDRSVTTYDDIKGISNNMYYISHSEPEKVDDEMKSRSNLHEAKYVKALCWYLMLQGYKPEQITILTPYTGQLLAIRRHMPKKQFEGVRITAVDNFQGEENDIIILSLVRSNNEGRIGFLREDNRVCVALSRAKMGFFVIGNFELFSMLSTLWSKIVQTLKNNGSVGPSLPLYCQNHPESGIEAQKASDFQKAPEGGCQRPCGTRLECGHVCIRACHTYDTDHEKYKCAKPCAKVLCANNHRCKKICGLPCGTCRVPMEKVIPTCKHVQMVPCSISPNAFSCLENCGHVLDCGHLCQNLCGDSHTTQCMNLVEVPLKCDHTIQVYCSEKDGALECTAPCKKTLDCQHVCAGTCGKCFEGRLHQPCRNGICGRVLVCGHQCRDPCTVSCPPCKSPCENRCTHSNCAKTCGKPCKPCIEPCPWRCRHFKCSKLCNEPCNRPRCNMPCRRRLPCGHHCIGLCGETCPTQCRVCNKEEVETIIFGNEDEPESRFVLLEDCHHIVEVNALDQWMETPADSKDDNVHVQLKVCPLCKTPIRRNLRYGNMIKSALSDIEKVKRVILGQKNQIDEMKIQVQSSVIHLDHEDGTEIERRLENEYLTLEEVTALVNSVTFLRSLKKNEESLKEVRRVVKLDINSLLKSIKRLKDFILSSHRYSDQTLNECRQEANRISLQVHLRSLKGRAAKLGKWAEVAALFKSCKRIFAKKCPLDGGSLEQISKIIKTLEKSLPRSGLGITEQERVEIVQAMGLSKGHWYKCPNGHVYAIGDCGGANQGGICPECKKAIGGVHHTLAQGNRVAGEMDGARYAAWSDEANREMGAEALY